MMSLRVIGTLIVCASFGTISSASAQTTNDAQIRINLASGQATLAESITQSACMLHVGIQPDVYSVKLTEARNSFATTLDGLSGNGSKIGLDDETNAALLFGQGEVESAWTKYSTILTAISSTDADTLGKLDASGREVLDRVLDAAALTARVHGASAVDLTMAEALVLNIAGRQRMFSQSMLKEMCLLTSGTEPDQNRERYSETVRLFTASLKALQYGQADVGLPPPPSAEIEAKLLEIDEMWQPMRSFMEDFAQADEPDPIYLEIIAEHMNTLEAALEQVYSEYEDAT